MHLLGIDLVPGRLTESGLLGSYATESGSRSVGNGVVDFTLLCSFSQKDSLILCLKIKTPF